MTHPTDDSLKPCPFCGAGTTEITPNGRMWTGMKYSEPSSVSVRHWCEAVPGQPSRMIERVGRDEASAIDAWNTRALLAEQARTEPVTKWRCFHCDEEFTDADSAALHFGKSQMDTPACTVDVVHLRDLEAQLRSYREEDTDLMRYVYRLGADHQTALMREEEKGYARGLKDGQELTPPLTHKAEDAPSDAARDVLAERQRQISKEGWTIHHDDEHDTGEMADAAAVYALRASGHFESGVPTYWPWAESDYKPKDKRTNLVRAGALILAEIERLDRAAIAQERKA